MNEVVHATVDGCGVAREREKERTYGQVGKREGGREKRVVGSRVGGTEREVGRA